MAGGVNRKPRAQGRDQYPLLDAAKRPKVSRLGQSAFTASIAPGTGRDLFTQVTLQDPPLSGVVILTNTGCMMSLRRARDLAWLARYKTDRYSPALE